MQDEPAEEHGLIEDDYVQDNSVLSDVEEVGYAEDVSGVIDVEEDCSNNSENGLIDHEEGYEIHKKKLWQETTTSLTTFVSKEYFKFVGRECSWFGCDVIFSDSDVEVNIAFMQVRWH